jgi:hypothetical protein
MILSKTSEPCKEDKTSFYVLPVLVAQQCIAGQTSAIATAYTENMFLHALIKLNCLYQKVDQLYVLKHGMEAILKYSTQLQ